MERPKGIHKIAFAAFISACMDANVDPHRIVQTLGHAQASAGTHGKDGIFTNESGEIESYSAALDLSVKHPPLTVTQREALLKALWDEGFAAWYRTAPEFPGNQHIHAIYMGVPMKRSLRNQAHSFLAHRSGLVSGKADKFVAANLTDAAEQNLRKMFLSCNQMNG